MRSDLAAGINTVVVCPSLAVRNLLIEIIQSTSGIVPTAKKDTVSAQRAHYAPAEAKVIINTPAQAMYETLGRHYVAVAVEVESTMEAAHLAETLIVAEGFSAEVHRRAEPEFPEDFIVFVTSPALEGIALLFWPKNPDPEILKTLDRPSPWTNADLNNA